MIGPVVPVVIDTNVLVSTLYRKTPILQFILNGNIVVPWNQFTKAEAIKIIFKLHQIKPYRDTNVNSILNLLEFILDPEDKVSEMPGDWPKVSPDRKDDPFLYVAATYPAEYIISLDKQHMLKLRAFNGIPIGIPRSFFLWAKTNRPMKA